jgi:uncharacterized membrane protein
MAVQVRVRDKDSLAVSLGWFSIGLGAAQIAAPRALCRLIGANTDGAAPRLMRLMGVREITHGTGILVRPRPTMWMWSRVAGDVLDLSLLGVTAAKNRRARTAFALANVLVVTAADVYESRFLSQRKGPVRSARLTRKAVTINRPRREVEEAWNASELRAKVAEAGASVFLAEAPGNRGTELIVEFEYDPPLGDLGSAAEKLTGTDLATQLSDDLRRFKQQVETGQVVRSEGTPDGHLLADHLKQRAARPLEEAVR